MTFDRYKKWLILLITISSIISACGLVSSKQTVAPTTEEPVAIIYDGGFLSGVPCSAPCFFGSSPGLTKKEDLLNNLDTYQIFPFCDKDDLQKDWSRSLSCKPNMFFWFDGDDITEISFKTQSAITLGQVIEKYGNPESIDFARGGTDESILLKAVVFQSYQFVVHVKDSSVSTNGSQDSFNYNFSPDMEITWIDYVDKETLISWIDKCSVPWKGYGSYPLNPGC